MSFFVRLSRAFWTSLAMEREHSHQKLCVDAAPADAERHLHRPITAAAAAS